MATIKERVLNELGEPGNHWTIIDIFELLKIDDPEVNLNSIRTCIRRDLIDSGVFKPVSTKGKAIVFETIKEPPPRTKLKTTTTIDLVLQLLREIKVTGMEEITSRTLINRVREIDNTIKPSSIYPLFTVELSNRKIVARTGASVGNSRIYKILPSAEKIRDVYYSKSKPRHPATASELAQDNAAVQPVEPVETSDDDEIDAVVFGDKIFRYWSILKERLNTTEADLKEATEKDKSAIRGLQDEIDRLRKENSELREANQGRISKSRYQEVTNEKYRLEKLVDEQNARIKAMSGKRGSSFKLGELAKVR